MEMATVAGCLAGVADCIRRVAEYCPDLLS
jgi:hypothetical protein